jgi:hypothetical protein
MKMVKNTPVMIQGVRINEFYTGDCVSMASRKWGEV